MSNFVNTSSTPTSSNNSSLPPTQPPAEEIFDGMEVDVAPTQPKKDNKRKASDADVSETSLAKRQKITQGSVIVAGSPNPLYIFQIFDIFHSILKNLPRNDFLKFREFSKSCYKLFYNHYIASPERVILFQEVFGSKSLNITQIKGGLKERLGADYFYKRNRPNTLLELIPYELNSLVCWSKNADIITRTGKNQQYKVGVQTDWAVSNLYQLVYTIYDEKSLKAFQSILANGGDFINLNTLELTILLGSEITLDFSKFKNLKTLKLCFGDKPNSYNLNATPVIHLPHCLQRLGILRTIVLRGDVGSLMQNASVFLAFNEDNRAEKQLETLRTNTPIEWLVSGNKDQKITMDRFKKFYLDICVCETVYASLLAKQVELIHTSSDISLSDDKSVKSKFWISYDSSFLTSFLEPHFKSLKDYNIELCAREVFIKGIRPTYHWCFNAIHQSVKKIYLNITSDVKYESLIVSFDDQSYNQDTFKNIEFEVETYGRKMDYLLLYVPPQVNDAVLSQLYEKISKASKGFIDDVIISRDRLCLKDFYMPLSFWETHSLSLMMIKYFMAGIEPSLQTTKGVYKQKNFYFLGEMIDRYNPDHYSVSLVIDFMDNYIALSNEEKGRVQLELQKLSLEQILAASKLIGNKHCIGLPISELQCLFIRLKYILEDSNDDERAVLLKEIVSLMVDTKNQCMRKHDSINNKFIKYLISQLDNIGSTNDIFYGNQLKRLIEFNSQLSMKIKNELLERCIKDSVSLCSTSYLDNDLFLIKLKLINFGEDIFNHLHSQTKLVIGPDAAIARLRMICEAQKRGLIKQFVQQLIESQTTNSSSSSITSNNEQILQLTEQEIENRFYFSLYEPSNHALYEAEFGSEFAQSLKDLHERITAPQATAIGAETLEESTADNHFIADQHNDQTAFDRLELANPISSADLDALGSIVDADINEWFS